VEISIVHATACDDACVVDLGPHRMMLRPRETPHLRLIEH
jgi:hypothetical protein